MMQFQHRCGVGRTGHVQCVYISLYMCVYTAYLNYLYITFLELCTPTALRHPRPGVSHDISTLAEGVMASPQRSFCRLCLFFLYLFFLRSLVFLQFSNGSLESGVRGRAGRRAQPAGGRTFPPLSSRTRACSRRADRVIPAACECTGPHRRLKFICTNDT